MHRIAHEYLVIFFRAGDRRVFQVDSQQRQLFLHQPIAEPVGVTQEQFTVVRAGVLAHIQLLQHQSCGLAVACHDRAKTVFKQLEEPAVAMQGLAEGGAADHRVAHHRPAAYGRTSGAITQRLILQGEHGAHLQVGKALHREPGIVFQQQAWGDAVLAQ